MTTLPDLDLSAVAEHRAYDTYLVVRAPQGSRSRFTVQMDLGQVPFLLPIPDPEKTAPGNRRVDLKHAKAFGDYVVSNPETWVCPPLLLRADEVDSKAGGPLYFEQLYPIRDGLVLGYLHVKRGSSVHFKILDGQHRILGVNLKRKELADTLARLEDRIAELEDSESEEEANELIEIKDRRVDALQQWEIFNRATFTLDIYVEAESAAYKQMFYDIAQNAKGMTESVKTRFDTRKVVNRAVALDQLIDHPLLHDRLELEKDRIEGTSHNLITAKTVADIVRTVAVGYNGRISGKKEEDFSEAALAQGAVDFLDTMSACFTDLAAIEDGSMTPAELRGRGTLLASATMWRVLAGVYHHLLANGHTVDDVRELFDELDPLTNTAGGVHPVWFRTGQFEVNTPSGRREKASALVKIIASWTGDTTDEIANWEPKQAIHAVT